MLVQRAGVRICGPHQATHPSARLSTCSSTQMKGRPSTKQTHLTFSRLGTKAQTQSPSAKASSLDDLVPRLPQKHSSPGTCVWDVGSAGYD
ncbi:hypothetical protein IscW_ISCW024845 [Ixodes scapularis]|uniref:Uncharacterized protein n=1 Tax=Ixodes scapularis TaxID=6945 RepID=B7QL76_IXOSC|nr:hypothetical protein IscW_ISCW024845 [Ixodes scapularis]|eukprot:XP_002415931.1 hypothetical protein IscW_ISCW024845 [Ixodes scapularis]